jgi:hypothetical protein
MAFGYGHTLRLIDESNNIRGPAVGFSRLAHTK